MSFPIEFLILISISEQTQQQIQIMASDLNRCFFFSFVTDTTVLFTLVNVLKCSRFMDICSNLHISFRVYLKIVHIFFSLSYINSIIQLNMHSTCKIMCATFTWKYLNKRNEIEMHENGPAWLRVQVNKISAIMDALEARQVEWYFYQLIFKLTRIRKMNK